MKRLLMVILAMITAGCKERATSQPATAPASLYIVQCAPPLAPVLRSDGHGGLVSECVAPAK